MKEQTDNGNETENTEHGEDKKELKAKLVLNKENLTNIITKTISNAVPELSVINDKLDNIETMFKKIQKDINVLCQKFNVSEHFKEEKGKDEDQATNTMAYVRKKVTLIRDKKSVDDPDIPTIQAEAIFDTNVKHSLVRKDLGERMIFFGYYGEPMQARVKPTEESTPRPIKFLGTSTFSFQVNGCGANIGANLVEPDEIDADLIIGRNDMHRSGIKVKESETEEGKYVLDLEECIKKSNTLTGVR
ncbi:MAG: hypothetical protein R6U96_19025, partial [Promethearchaeia archaeon]